MSLGSAFETKFSTSARYGAVLNLVRRTAVGPTKYSAAQLVDADDEHQNKNKHLGTAEACSARERPGRGGRWCGLNDRTLTCEVVLCVGHKANKSLNNIRYSSRNGPY